MPDRDELSKMPCGIRRYSKSLGAAAEGEPLEPIVAAKVFKGGIKHLAAILACISGPGSLEEKLDCLDVIRRDTPGNKLDLLAHRAAERVLLRGESDPAAVVRDLIDASVGHLILDSKNGMPEANHDASAASRLRSALAEPIDRAREKLLQNPGIKSLGLAKGLKRPVDLSEPLPFQGGPDV